MSREMRRGSSGEGETESAADGLGGGRQLVVDEVPRMLPAGWLALWAGVNRLLFALDTAGSLGSGGPAPGEQGIAAQEV